MPTITHSTRQQPVAATFDHLLTEAEATARAIADNAQEDRRSIDPLAARNWWARLDRIAAAITHASHLPPVVSYLPTYRSCTGKELL